MIAQLNAKVIGGNAWKLLRVKRRAEYSVNVMEIRTAGLAAALAALHRARMATPRTEEVS